MAFHLQDPGNPDATFLLEVLIKECQVSTGGGASFAWATRRGVNLFLENAIFLEFIKHNTFDLIIGVDAVTDVSALEALSSLQSQLDNLTVSVFLNLYTGPLFHPKVSWFRHEDGGSLITGSGNLTGGGLSNNWEAFTVTQLDDQSLADVDAQWAAWKASYPEDFFDPSDSAVLERAQKNKHESGASTGSSGGASSKNKQSIKNKLPWNKQVAAQTTAKNAEGQGTSSATETPSSVMAVLVAEIPKGSTRWNQANFDQDNYENYFGAKLGTQRIMFFTHVQEDGSTSELEIRPSVAVKSSNYRFELAAAAGLEYPSAGRPIVVFVRQSIRNFLYRLVMPGDAAHQLLADFLDAKWDGPVGRMKRVRSSIEELETVWGDSPLWLVPDEQDIA